MQSLSFLASRLPRTLLSALGKIYSNVASLQYQTWVTCQRHRSLCSVALHPLVDEGLVSAAASNCSSASGLILPFRSFHPVETS